SAAAGRPPPSGWRGRSCPRTGRWRRRRRRRTEWLDGPWEEPGRSGEAEWGVVDQLHVPDRLPAADQEGVVLGVEARALDGVTGEAADGLPGVPEGEEQEVCPLPLDAPKSQDAAVAGRPLVVGEPGATQVREVPLGVRGSRASFPESGDQRRHRSSSLDTGQCVISGVKL